MLETIPPALQETTHSERRQTDLVPWFALAVLIGVLLGWVTVWLAAGVRY